MICERWSNRDDACEETKASAGRVKRMLGGSSYPVTQQKLRQATVPLVPNGSSEAQNTPAARASVRAQTLRATDVSSSQM